MNRGQRDVAADRTNLTQGQDGLRNQTLVAVKPVLERFSSLLKIKPQNRIVSGQ